MALSKIDGKQLDTTSSNFTLSDLTTSGFYRTDTWTPVISGIGATDEEATVATGTYQQQYGIYQRIGDLVHASFSITMPSSWSYTNGGASNQPFTVSALPFKIKNDSGYNPMTSTLYWRLQVSNWDASLHGFDLAGVGVTDKKYIRFYYKGRAEQYAVNLSNTANGMEIIGSLTYCTEEA